MKVKKYPQSHIVITNDLGNKLIIDPGYLTFDPSASLRTGGKVFKVEEFQGADVYLITHQHPDHLDLKTIKEVVGENLVYGNADVVAKLKEVGVNANEVKNGQNFSASGFEITTIDLPHFPHPLGNKVPPNTGFVINGVFFHPGDGYELANLTVDNAALPIGHPFLSTTKVLEFAKSLQAKVVIPIHYDAYPRDPEEFKKFAKELGIEVRTLAPGEETTI